MAWARAYYSLGMKTWMLLAAMILAPIGAHAEPPANDGGRAELIKEIEAARASLLPQSEPLPPVTVRHQPRLNELKAAAVAAKTPAQILKARKDFTDWKTALTEEIRAEISRFIPGGQSFGVLSARRGPEADFAAAVHRQLADQRVEAEMSPILSAARRPAADASWASLFDNRATARWSPLATAPDGAVRAPAPPAANDPARYAKIRALLLSQGVSHKIIDTAIAEGIRQKVDPMIVLSVINQESNFHKNAYNKGSGCTGLMQLDRETAAEMGVHGSLYDPAANIKAGTKYMNWIANSFFKMGQDLSDLSKIPAEKLKIVLASYNWGVGNVSKSLRKHGAAALDHVAPKETRDYIAEIPSRITSWFASI